MVVRSCLSGDGVRCFGAVVHGAVRRCLAVVSCLTVSASHVALAVVPVVEAHAVALPEGGVVAQGSATIARGADHVVVDQQSAGALIDWQSFSIGASGSVTFNQPSADALAVNRVVGTQASQILGRMTANGRVALVNPNGITFGDGARVDVGGLVASVRALADDGYLSTGVLRFGGAAGGDLVNRGVIEAAQGVSLVGARIVNSGTLAGRDHGVFMAAGGSVTLDTGRPWLLEVDAASFDTLVSQSGSVRTGSGHIVMEARSLHALAAGRIEHSGVFQAAGGSSGGSVSLFGSTHVSVHGGARVAHAGGSVRVGGGGAMLGGVLDVSSGIDGGGITVDVDGGLHLSGTLRADGGSGSGGGIRLTAGSVVENAASAVSASGGSGGGVISLVAGGSVLSSGSYAARGGSGTGGRIDVTGGGVTLLGARYDASGDGRRRHGASWRRLPGRQGRCLGLAAL